jgi:hypothetical protein
MNSKDIKNLNTNYKICFGSENGEKVLEDLERRCNANVTTFVKGDSYESAYLEGQRSVYLFIKSMINKKNGGNNE